MIFLNLTLYDVNFEIDFWTEKVREKGQGKMKQCWKNEISAPINKNCPKIAKSHLKSQNFRLLAGIYLGVKCDEMTTTFLPVAS